MANKNKNKGGNVDVPYENSGPSMLSEQPSDPKEKSQTKQEISEWGTVRSHLESELNSLRSWQFSWWSENYSQLAMYIEPRRSTWLTQSAGNIPSPNNMGRGKPINSAILDPTGTYAVRVCASGIMSGLASPARPWFKLTTSVKNVKLDDKAREWMDEVEDRIYTVLASSNFYKAFAQECEDLVVFGTSPSIIYEDKADIIRLYTPCIGEYFLSSSGSLRVDGLYRMFLMTVKQMVDYFGVENCPEDIQKLWKAKGASLNVERIVAHVIEPNFAVGEGEAGKIKGKFDWREIYWVWGAGSEYPLSSRGFIEKPFTAARWSTQSNDAYGRSVGMDVLPDVIQLQVETMRKAEAIEKMVRPPLLADMQLKNQPSSSLPGAVTYVNNLGPNSGMRSMYDVDPRIAEMMQDIAAIQQRIKVGFFNDIILMLSSNPVTNRTAYETAQLVQERLQVLGPVIENIIGESLKPKLKRIYSIMMRNNMFPPMPASMNNVSIDVEFISMLALAQKASSTGGIERLAGFVGNLVAVYPEAKDNVNVDKMIAVMSSMLDNPQEILRGDKEKQQIRAAQAKQMQAAQQQQAMAQGAQTVNTGAQAAQVLSNTQVGSGQSALDQLFGQKQ